MAIRQ